MKHRKGLGSLAFYSSALFLLAAAGNQQARADSYGVQFQVSSVLIVDGSNSFWFYQNGYADYQFDGSLTDPGPQTMTFFDGNLFPGSNLGTLTSPGVVNGSRTYTETSTPTSPNSPDEVSFILQNPTAPGTYSGYGDEAVELFSNLVVDGQTISSITAPLTVQIDENVVVCFNGACSAPGDPGTATTPEPSGLLLILTGICGITGALLQRRTSARRKKLWSAAH